MEPLKDIVTRAYKDKENGWLRPPTADRMTHPHSKIPEDGSRKGGRPKMTW